MQLDPDIVGAVDALALDRIRLQEWRNHLAKMDAATVGNSDAFRSHIGMMREVGTGLLSAQAEARLEIVRAIGANYMKPTTGTLPETIAKDTAADAERLRAAVDAVMAIINAA